MVEATPLVMLHGWGVNSAIWAGQVGRLSANFTLSTPDLPGYGDQPMEWPLTLENMACALLACWPTQVDVCGWSMGGMVAMTAARLAPQRVRRLVLVGATPCFVARHDWVCGVPAQVFEQFALSLANDYQGTLKRFLALQVHGDMQARITMAVLRNVLLAQGQPSEGVLRAGLQVLLDSDMRESLPTISQPTLVVYGGYDQLVPACATQYLLDRLPQVRQVNFSHASHAPFLSHADEFSTVVHNFLAGDAR